MIYRLREMLGLARAPEREVSAVPDGQRVYAVGDIHGRADLFEAMMTAIDADDAAGLTARTTVILLGDLVDRGPQSALVIEQAMAWRLTRPVRILCGNHEEMFLESFERHETLRHFLRFGGRETLLSYGIEPTATSRQDLENLQSLMARQVPKAHIDFMAGFEDMIRIGDYVFVHAGIAPDLPLENQSAKDLRWIREPFLSQGQVLSQGQTGAYVVVHGHTIFEQADVQQHRIGIDTGAYASSRLTALVLEGTSRRFLETALEDGAVTTTARRA